MKNIRNFRGLIWVPVIALAFLAACDNLLDVVDPDRVNPTTLEDPDVIDVVIAGAISDFTVAYSGAGLADAILSSTAAMSDEFFSTGSFTTRTATDRRNQLVPANGNLSDGAYINLQQARRSLMNALPKIADHPDKGTADPEFAELSALWGYTYLALGEAYCSSVPISNDEEPDPSDGPPRTSMELFQEAVPIFAAAGSTNLANMGHARALMNIGDYAAAAGLVGGVPTDWTYFIEHSDNAANNPFFNLQSNGRWSLSHFEGGSATGMPFRGTGAGGFDPALADPRIPWFEDPLGGFTPTWRLFTQLKYPLRKSSVILTSGIEARLIEAEAALAVGGGWLAILNTLRADVEDLMGGQIDNYADAMSDLTDPTLAPLVDPGAVAARVDMLFQERAFWLWGTGTRLGDLRRLINQYSRTEAAVYPSGAYHKGGVHGIDVVFPLDFDEINNPLYDPSTCVVTSAGFN